MKNTINSLQFLVMIALFAIMTVGSSDVQAQGQAPTQVYSAPIENNAAPTQNYALPAQNYAAPVQGYGQGYAQGYAQPYGQGYGQGQGCPYCGGGSQGCQTCGSGCGNNQPCGGIKVDLCQSSGPVTFYPATSPPLKTAQRQTYFQRYSTWNRFSGRSNYNYGRNQYGYRRGY